MMSEWSNVRPHSSQRALGLLAVTMFMVVGCANPGSYRQPIARFQNASSAVVASSRVYLQELNKVERDAYIDRQLSKREPIVLAEINKVQIFSAEGIGARLQALTQLTQYGELLTQLAASDAPDRIAQGADDLKSAIEKLQTDVGNLTGNEDLAFKAALGPVTALFKEVARLVANKAIQDALDKAITDGEAPVRSLMVAIRNDLELAYERRRNALSDRRVQSVRAYNEVLERPRTADPEILQRHAEHLKSNLDQWEIFPASNPSTAIDAMQRAHEALVDYAKSPKTPEDFAALVEAMEAFVAHAKAVAEALQGLVGRG